MSRHNALLSRVADSVYWTGRYVERAENVARFIGVNLHLMLDMPSGSDKQWQPLIDTSGDARAFAARNIAATERNVIEFLAFDPENPNSIVSCVRAARENARSVRETISSEMWMQINDLYLLTRAADSGLGNGALADYFGKIRMGCHLFQGLTDATMSHNEAWHFLELGRNLERADKSTRLLDVKYFILLPSVRDVGTPFDDIQWSAVLKSVSGFEMYRKRHGRIEPGLVADFLLLDPQFPRTVRFCLSAADDSLHAITATPPGTFSCPSEQQLGRLRSELDFAQTDSILSEGLHQFLDGLQRRMNSVDDCVLNDFFVQSDSQRQATTLS